MGATAKRVRDRRIERTRTALRDALAELVHEKPYDAIAVSEILERANIGRSTFYAHFRDKDELLAESIRDMLRAVPSPAASSSRSAPERIIDFSLLFFEHHYRHREMPSIRAGPKGRAIVHEHLRRVLTELIGDDVRKAARRKAIGRIPPDLLVQYVASTFVLVLNWWAAGRNPLPPKEANDVYRALILPTLMEALA